MEFGQIWAYKFKFNLSGLINECKLVNLKIQPGEACVTRSEVLMSAPSDSTNTTKRPKGNEEMALQGGAASSE